MTDDGLPGLLARMRRACGLGAAAGILLGSPAAACAASAVHAEPALGIRVVVPVDWRVTSLAPGGEWRIGIATPATQRAARANGQPAQNPRYQDVLVGLLRAPSLDEAARPYCRGDVERLRVAGAPAVACDAQHAVGGEVRLLVAAREVFVQGPRGIVRLATEGGGERLEADRRSAFEAVLRALELAS